VNFVINLLVLSHARVLNIIRYRKLVSIYRRGRRDRGRMAVGFTTTYAISAYHH